jgi:hypothetical protein
MINFVFSSASFNDAIRRIQYLKSYRNYREDQVQQINTTQKEIELRIAALSQNKIEKNNMLDEHTKEMKVLEIEKKEQSNYVQQLKAREKELSSEINTKKKLDRNIQNAISSIVKREIEAARKAAEAEAKRMALAKANLGFPIVVSAGTTSTIYSVGSAKTAYIRSIVIANSTVGTANTSLAQTVQIYMVPNNSGSVGVATSGNRIGRVSLTPATGAHGHPRTSFESPSPVAESLACSALNESAS